MRGRYGKTKSAAREVLSLAADWMAANGRPRKLPNQPRPEYGAGKNSTTGSIEWAAERRGVTRTAEAVAYEAAVQVIERDWPFGVQGKRDEGLTDKQIVEWFDNNTMDTREIVRTLKRAEKALA